MAFINLKNDKYWEQLSNPDYWKKRSEELDKYLEKTQKETIKEVNKAYREAFNNINKEVSDFMMKYATDNKLDYNTISQVLSPVDIATYNERMEELRAMYRDTQSEYIKREIAELDARMYVTRQQALMDSINVELSKTAHNFQMTLEECMTGLFTDQYAEVAQMLGVMVPNIPTEAIKKIIEYPYHGQMFADSIWKNKKDLCNYINKKMVQGIIRGDSIQKMSRALKKDLNVLYYQAERLVRTETNYAMNQGHLEGYKASDVVESYQFLAAHDHRTSKLCREMDGKLIPLDKAQVGVNCPPLHPHCRSTIIPVIEDY